MPNVDLTQLKTQQDMATERLDAWREDAIRSKAEFAIALADAAIITEAEAEGWIDGTLPTAVSTAVLTLPAEEQTLARITIKGASEIHRTAPLLILLGTAYGLTEAEIDALFGTPPS